MIDHFKKLKNLIDRLKKIEKLIDRLIGLKKSINLFLKNRLNDTVSNSNKK